jgi:hypothetical protein
MSGRQARSNSKLHNIYWRTLLQGARLTSIKLYCRLDKDVKKQCPRWFGGSRRYSIVVGKKRGRACLHDRKLLFLPARSCTGVSNPRAISIRRIHSWPHAREYLWCYFQDDLQQIMRGTDRTGDNYKPGIKNETSVRKAAREVCQLHFSIEVLKII